MTCLFVDGPAKGEVRDITLPGSPTSWMPYQVLIPVELDPSSPPPLTASFEMETVTYYRHKLVLMSYGVRIMSIHVKAADIDALDVMDVLLSADARQALFDPNDRENPI